MSSLDHRIQRLEEALQPRSKGHRFIIVGDSLSPRPALSQEEGDREAARLKHEGYTVTIIRFVPTEEVAVRQLP